MKNMYLCSKGMRRIRLTPFVFGKVNYVNVVKIPWSWWLLDLEYKISGFNLWLHLLFWFCRRGPASRILLVAIISLLTSCFAYGLPWFARCTPCPTGTENECPTVDRSGNYKNFQCEAGHYNDLASLFLNTSDDAIRNLLSNTNRNEFHISTLFIFFVGTYFLGIVTYGIAIPSGLFIPVILAGASYGRLVGRVLGSMSTLDLGLFSVLGAASFLGGTMRMTVSMCVILLELTNNLLMLPMMMLVLLISKTVADAFNSGVYDQIVKMKGLPYMEAHAEPYMKHLAARDVCSGPLITFSGVEKVGDVLHALQMTRHNGFPVIDEPPFTDAPELCGLVLRSHLLVLLQRKKFTNRKVESGAQAVRVFNAFDFAKPGLGKGLKVEDLDISEEELDMYVDLHPITNSSPYMVVDTMSLAKASILFRQLALRHLCVVPKTPGVNDANALLLNFFMTKVNKPLMYDLSNCFMFCSSFRLSGSWRGTILCLSMFWGSTLISLTTNRRARARCMLIICTIFFP